MFSYWAIVTKICLQPGTSVLDHHQQQCEYSGLLYSRVELMLAVNQIPARVLMHCLPRRGTRPWAHMLISMEMSCISDQANMKSHIVCCSRVTASYCCKVLTSQCRCSKSKDYLIARNWTYQRIWAPHSWKSLGCSFALKWKYLFILPDNMNKWVNTYKLWKMKVLWFYEKSFTYINMAYLVFDTQIWIQRQSAV